MKKGFIIILTMFLLITLSGCNSEKITAGFTIIPTGGMFSGFTAIEIEKSKYKVSSPLPVKFFYGHDIQFEAGDPDYERIQNINIYISLYGRDDPKYHFNESVTIYSKEFEPSEFITDEYRISTSYVTGTSIEFNQEFSFDIDLSDFNFQEGRITISISKTILCETCEENNGYATFTEKTSIDFTISNGYVRFD